MIFNRKTKKKTIKKYAVIRTTSKGYAVEYREPRKIVHGGNF